MYLLPLKKKKHHSNNARQIWGPERANPYQISPFKNHHKSLAPILSVRFVAKKEP